MDLESDLTGIHTGLEAHVLGNGESRRVFVRPGPKCVVLGCNAAYRDVHEVDYVAALDFRMLGEILDSGWPGRVLSHRAQAREVCRRRGRSVPAWWSTVNPAPSLPGTGFFAIFCACIMGCNPVHLWGFDGGDGNNLYAGTPNYSQVGNTLQWNSLGLQFRERLLYRFMSVEFIAHGGSYLDVNRNPAYKA